MAFGEKGAEHVVLSEGIDRTTAGPVPPSRTWLASCVFTASVIAIGYFGDHWTLAIYALSFWHYVVYALAFRFRAVPLADFRRDALLLKSVSLAAFFAVYLTAGPSLLSLLVAAAGFALNIAAARALGVDRTYYGYELARLPAKHITAFPYSIMAHPMLLGNMAAFGGTLLDASFRAAWWPLATAHVLLNLAILVMEARGSAARRKLAAWPKRLGAWQAGGAFLVASTLLGLLAGNDALSTGAISLCVLAHGTILLGAYTRRAFPEPKRADDKEDNAGE